VLLRLLPPLTALKAMGDLEGKKLTKGIMACNDDTVEPTSSFSKRLSKWWDEAILKGVLSKTKEGEDVNVLIVTHGGVIGTLVGDLLGSQKIEPATGVAVWACMNTSVTVVEMEYGGGKGVLARYGDVRHLQRT
jgi:probable phosphoglycerate mutase